MNFAEDQQWLDAEASQDEAGEDDIIDTATDDDLDSDLLAEDPGVDPYSQLELTDELPAWPVSSASVRHVAALRAIEIAREQRALRNALEDFPDDEPTHNPRGL